MKEVTFLPDGAALEAGKLVPPNNQIQFLGSFSFQEMDSVSVSNCIEDYEKRGLRPIILVGCDIKNFTNINIANDYDKTEWSSGFR